MKKNSIKTNLIYNMIYQVLMLLIPLITTPYISRVIGANGVGIYSYHNSIALYFSYFAMLGILNYGNRTIAKVRDDEDEKNKKFTSIYILQILTTIFILALYIIYSMFFVNTDRTVSIIMTLYVSASLFDVSWLFFGLEEFKITSIRQIIIRIVTLILIFVFINQGTDLNKYVLIMSASNLFSALSLWLLTWKRVKLKRVSFNDVKKHFMPCLVLFIPIIATSIYRQMDKIMVGMFCNMTEVGYYESAEKLITISLGIVAAFSAVIMPKISNLIENKKDKEAKDLFNISMKFAMFIGIAIAFGISSISNEFVPLFFGDGYTPSILLSIVLSISVPFISWACIVRTLYLIPHEKDKIYVKSIVLGAILNVVCNLIFIPRIGTMGAVVGTLVAESSVAIYQTIKSKKYLEIKKYIKDDVVFMLSGIIMSVAVRFIAKIFNDGTVKTLIIEILVGAIVYCLLTGIYFIINKDESFLKILKFNKKNKKEDELK
ncbi:MAG: flippase [Clostridia bacterium]|nr:flippase [Clostridia bacterium]